MNFCPIFWALLALLPTYNNAIRCICEFHQSCDELANFCETDVGGYCFASLFRDQKTGEITQVKRCIDSTKAFPPGRPLICEYR